MKKILLMTGAGLLLASCGNAVISDDLVIYTNSLVLESNYQVQNTSFNGSSYSGPVVCDDRQTDLNFDFDYSGDLQQVTLSLVGNSTNERQTLNVTNSGFNGSHGFVDFYVPSQTAPLGKPGKIKSQAIVVNPTVLGASHIEMVAYSSSGQTDTIQSNSIPVLASCN